MRRSVLLGCVWRLTSVSLVPGDPKPQRSQPAGEGVELRLPAGHQTQEVLQLLPQTRCWTNASFLLLNRLRLKSNFSSHLRLCVFVCTEKALQSLLESLTCPPLTPTQHLEREQALAKQFAEILHFTLRFDELKVCGNTRAKLRRTHSQPYPDTSCVVLHGFIKRVRVWWRNDDCLFVL